MWGLEDALDSESFDRVVDAVCKERGWSRDKQRIEVPLEGGRHQDVMLENFEFEDEALVRVYTWIGPTEDIEPLRLNTALRLNFGLPHGSLALKNDRLAMVDTLLVEDPDPAEIEASIGYLAETADHFERTIFGGDEF